MGPSIEATADDANAATLELGRYFRELINERARQRGTDLISELAELEAQGQVTEQELIGLAVFIFAAAQTPLGFLATALMLLLAHPEQKDRWLADPSIADLAIEELLRYEAPLQILSAIAVAPLEMRGRKIQPGDLIILVLGAANRDPDPFPEPDRLDVGRSPNRHLSFGWSTHFCLGAPLTRVEARITIDTTLRRFPSLQLADDRLDWITSMTERRLQRLPVLI